MALSLSSTCLAIALADKRNTLTVTERADRWGGSFVAIGDEKGTIEVVENLDAAWDRIAALRARAAS